MKVINATQAREFARMCLVARRPSVGYRMIENTAKTLRESYSLYLAQYGSKEWIEDMKEAAEVLEAYLAFE